MTANQFERPLEVQTLIDLTNDVATVLCPVGLPPGSRVVFQIKGVHLRGKVTQLKKDDSGKLEITVRLNNLSKEDRQRLID